MPPLRSRRPKMPVILAGLLVFVLNAILDVGSVSLHVPGALAQTAAAEVPGDLGKGDVRRAIESFSRLGDFYGSLAENDPNRHAAGFWTNTAETYRRAGLALSDLERRGAIRISDLGGERASDLEGGVIILDRQLGGQWQSHFVEATRRGDGDDWGYISQLSTVLLGDWLRLQPGNAENWFEAHRLRSSLAPEVTAAGNPALTRHLSSFWHLKDKYLWLAMARDDAGSNPPRLRDARKVQLFSEVTALTKWAERDLGAAWPNRLSGDWREFDRMVDHFSADRNWLIAEFEPGAAATRPVTTTTQTTGDLAATQRAPASSANSGQAATVAGAPQQDLEEKITKLAADLEISRQESTRLKDSHGVLAAALDKANKSQTQLSNELESARHRAAELEQEIETLRQDTAEAGADQEAQLAADLAASRAETAETEARLKAELEAERATTVALQQELDAERAANKENLSSLESQFTADLEASRAETGLIEARLTKELVSSRARTAALEQELVAERTTVQEAVSSLEARVTAELEATRATAAEVESSLTTELEASRTTIAALQQELETERTTSLQQAADLETQLANALDASRDEAAQTQARLIQELEQSLAAVAALEDELEAERAAGEEKASGLEARLAADLEDTRELAARREQLLNEELAASRKSLSDLEAALEAERVSVREGATQRVVKLGADLEASEQTVAALREQIDAEREAAQQKFAGIENRFTVDMKATEQTIAALRQKIEAERASSGHKLAALEAQLSDEPQKAQREAVALAERLTAELETSKQATAELREQMVSLERPAPGLAQGPWLATTSVMLLVILGLIAWIMVLWRQRSTVVMPDFAAAGATGVAPSLDDVNVKPNGRSAVQALPEPSAPTGPDQPGDGASPQLLVEALRQGDKALFESRFGAMTGLEDERLRSVIYGGIGEELVVACRALGIDKLVFASIFLLSRKHQAGCQDVGPQDLSRAMAAYDSTTENAALGLLEVWRQSSAAPEPVQGEEGDPDGSADTRH